jgi:autotransporter-associated beta strand protein
LNIAGGSFSTGNQVQVVTSAVVIDSGTATMGNFRTNSDFSGTLRLNAGILTCGDVNIRRNSAAAADFTSGFIVTGGAATATTIQLGTNNSTGAMSIEGGMLTASGTITVGNQVTAGRGGALRVLNGVFTSTDSANGIVLARTSGTNTNNVATATFTGGVSTVEKFTLGFDNTVTAGSATITMNGGNLYLGSGGIVKNGAAGLATTLSFGSGLLGAKANWSTSLPITLPTNGNIVFKAADAADVARDISFTGVLSGAGGFTKTGGGRLVLGAANTFGGAVAVNGGTLDVDGSVSAGADVSVNSGGTLAGDGTIGRSVVLNSGGRVAPGSATVGSVLTGSAVTWNAGGTLAFDLGAATNQLAVTGAFTKGGTGSRQFVFTGGPGLANGNTYTLVTFGSTNVTAADLTFSGIPSGLTGAFTVTSNSVVFNVFVPCAITCPANVIQANDQGLCSAVVNYAAPVTTGACGTVTCTPAAGSTFALGRTTVTCTTGSGLSCSFTVTINDTQKPVITCPASITQGNAPGQCSAIVNFAATASDNCSGSGAPACTPPSGSTFPKGSTTVSCTVSDAAGNSATCSFTVTVNDTQPPSINSSANITVANTAGQCSAAVTYSAPAVSDNCPGIGTPSCAPASGATFPKGTTTVICSVLDAAGNSASCSFNVTVNDTQAPTIVCPANITAVPPILGATCVNVSYPAPVVADNCPGASFACSPASGSCFPIGTTTVTCTATDASGNTASCSFAVTAFDLCVQDDSNGAMVVLINVTTGEYRFCCGGTVSNGTGTVSVRGNLVTIEHNSGTRRVLIRVDRGTKQGTASYASPPGVTTCQIRETNITNNSCQCQ